MDVLGGFARRWYLSTRQGGAHLPEIPGVLLCFVLGAVALGGARILPSHPLVPDVLLALFCGALVVNTPLKRILGNEREKERYDPGLRFVGRNVLRIAVILMGLKIQAEFFALNDVFVVFCAIAVAMSAAFFLTHAVAIQLKVPRPLADLIAAGTMICGASAVNAIAPVVGVKRQEQGIALATVFLFSVVALLLFHPIAATLGVPTVEAALWSGLAVNDLSSAVAVGAQMGPGGAEIAAASKSARIVFLAPLLIAFSIGRRTKSATPELRRHALGQLPRFVAGFVALAVVRALGDRFFGAAPLWRGVLATDRFLVDVAMMTVSAGIGLHLEIRGLLAVGARALVLGFVASCSMAALALELVMMGRYGGMLSQMSWGAAVVVGSYFAYRAATRSAGKPSPPLRDGPRAVIRNGFEALRVPTGRTRWALTVASLPVRSLSRPSSGSNTFRRSAESPTRASEAAAFLAAGRRAARSPRRTPPRGGTPAL